MRKRRKKSGKEKGGRKEGSSIGRNRMDIFLGIKAGKKQKVFESLNRRKPMKR